MIWLNESLYEDWNEFNFSWADNQSSCVVALASSSAEAVAAAFKALAMTAVIAAAVCGNMLVIVSVLRFERLRIIANSFLVSLAVADLLVAVLVMPFNALQQVAGRWPFGAGCSVPNAGRSVPDAGRSAHDTGARHPTLALRCRTLAVRCRTLALRCRALAVRCRMFGAGCWPFGAVVCDVFNANDVLFSTASLLHLCCVSVDRYVAVTDPFGYERRMTVRRVAAMLAFLWTASALLGHLPIHLGWYRDVSDNLIDDCRDVCEFNVNRVYGTHAIDRPVYYGHQFYVLRSRTETIKHCLCFFSFFT